MASDWHDRNSMGRGAYVLETTKQEVAHTKLFRKANLILVNSDICLIVCPMLLIMVFMLNVIIIYMNREINMNKTNSSIEEEDQNYYQHYQESLVPDQQQKKIILKLKADNDLLRKSLQQVNQRLYQALQKTEKTKKYKHRAKQEISDSVLKAELQNMYKKVDFLQKQNKQLLARDDLNTAYQKIAALEDKLKIKDQEIEDYHKQTKVLNKIKKTQAVALQNNQKQKNFKDNFAVLAEQKDEERRLKDKLRQVTKQKQQIQKRQRQKHEQLIRTQHKLKQLKQTTLPPLQNKKQLQILQISSRIEQDPVKQRQKTNKQTKEVIQLRNKVNQQKDIIRALKQIVMSRQQHQKIIKQMRNDVLKNDQRYQQNKRTQSQSINYGSMRSNDKVYI